MIHTRDHSPPHIHVVGPDGEVKFTLGTWEALDNQGFNERTVNMIRERLRTRESEFLEAWNEIHKDQED